MMTNICKFAFIFILAIICIQATEQIPPYKLPLARMSMPDLSTNDAFDENAEPTGKKGGIYDSNLARKMMPLSAAAYAENANAILACLHSFDSRATVKRQLTVDLPGQYNLFNWNVSGYTAVAPSESAIIISFRGTDGRKMTQAFEEINQSINWFNFYNIGYVERYFNDAFAFLWNHGMSNDFTTLKSQYPTFNVWVGYKALKNQYVFGFQITGHSLGGGMASIAAAFIVLTELHPGNKIKLYTFGQPRPGNKEFAAYIDSKIFDVFRIVHATDPIPHIPPPQIGYKHHASEIWYNNDMGPPPIPYEKCDDDTPTSCSNKVPLIDLLANFLGNVSDHDYYFKKHIDAVGTGYGSTGCRNETTTLHPAVADNEELPH